MFEQNLSNLKGASCTDILENLYALKQNIGYDGQIDQSLKTSIFDTLNTDTKNQEIEVLEFEISNLMSEIACGIYEAIIKSNKKLNARQDEITKAAQEALCEYRLRRGSMSKEQLISLLKEKINCICALDDDLIPNYISKCGDKLGELSLKMDKFSSLVYKNAFNLDAEDKLKFIDLYSKTFKSSEIVSKGRLTNTLNEDEFLFSKKSAINNMHNIA